MHIFVYHLFLFKRAFINKEKRVYSYILMFIFSICIFVYVFILFCLSLLFSLGSSSNSTISNNFECGFYSIFTSQLRYRFNYWLILFHFILFEQELIIAFLLLFGIGSVNSMFIVIFLYLLLFIDLFIYFYFTYISYFYVPLIILI